MICVYLRLKDTENIGLSLLPKIHVWKCLAVQIRVLRTQSCVAKSSYSRSDPFGEFDQFCNYLLSLGLSVKPNGYVKLGRLISVIRLTGNRYKFIFKWFPNAAIRLWSHTDLNCIHAARNRNHSSGKSIWLNWTYLILKSILNVNLIRKWCDPY